MKIKYTPTDGRGILEPGEYFAKVKNATGGYSAKGDQTIELELAIGRDGAGTLRDTLYNSERAAWRITQARRCFGFEDATGTEVEFEAADLIGCTGTVEVAMGAPKTSGKHEGKSFLEIKTYLSCDVVGETDDDNIPF